MIGERTIDGVPALTLASEAVGGIEAAIVPGAGVVVCSLLHRGEQVLGQRGGLRRYMERRSTMGIPLLYPWANRLSQDRFAVAGRIVDLALASPAPSRDPAGLPIHGLLGAARGWQVESHSARPDGGVLQASFDFASHPGLTDAFPFPHELLFAAELRGPALSITTTVSAAHEAPVPIAFGYHPYFRLPRVARAEWEVEVPVAERMLLDHRLLPTGEREPVEVAPGALGDRTFDDEYVAPPEQRPFILAGGGRRIEVAFTRGFPFAQVYAPADDDVIAFEPMTAPTNALVTGGSALPLLQAGDRHLANFSITISDRT